MNARAIPSLLHSTKIPEEVDEWGSNALHYAAEGGHADCIALLLDKSIDIQFQDHSGHTALILAAQVALEYLIFPGRSFLPGNKITATSSHCPPKLLQETRADAVRLLIQRNADVNARNKAGRTALHQILDADLPHASPSSPSQSTRKPPSLPPPAKALPPVRVFCITRRIVLLAESCINSAVCGVILEPNAHPSAVSQNTIICDHITVLQLLHVFMHTEQEQRAESGVS